MYQYKAKLKGTNNYIAEGHTVEEVEKHILTWKRSGKRSGNTEIDSPIEIIHFKKRKLLLGKYKQQVVKNI